MQDKTTLRFYNFILITACLPYSASIFPFLPSSIAGFALSGWGWMIMLIVSIATIASQKKTAMPYIFWLPWIIYVLSYNFFSFSLLGVQLSLQYINFILTGIAASSLYYSDYVLTVLLKRFKIFLGGVIILGIPYNLIFGYTPGAQQIVMTAIIAASFLLTIYFLYQRKKILLGYLVLVSIPLLNLTRMPLLAIFIIGIMHFANKSILQKIFFFLLLVVVTVGLFQLPAFQAKMFHSGSGTIDELFMADNENINTNGRDNLMAIMEKGIAKNPVLGNGPRSDLTAFIDEGLEIMEAHNDYLAVQYSYGYIGLGLLLLGFTFQFIHLYRLRKNIFNPVLRILCYTSLTIFIAWGLLMRTDNIMKYAIFFGNFHFCMIGMFYSLLKGNNEYYSSNTALQQG